MGFQGPSSAMVLRETPNEGHWRSGATLGMNGVAGVAEARSPSGAAFVGPHPLPSSVCPRL